MKGGIIIGGKYEDKPNNNPAPGQYESHNSILVTKTKSVAAHIAPPKNNSPNRTLAVRESGPDTSIDYKPFGSELKNKVDFGRKYEFKPSNNPAPG